MKVRQPADPIRVLADCLKQARGEYLAGNERRRQKRKSSVRADFTDQEPGDTTPMERASVRRDGGIGNWAGNLRNRLEIPASRAVIPTSMQVDSNDASEDSGEPNGDSDNSTGDSGEVVDETDDETDDEPDDEDLPSL